MEAPTRSGTQKDRRLAHTSVRAFYEEVYLPAVAKTTFPRRMLSTVVNWLQDFGVRPWVFDRYRCEVCFVGRQAESRIRNGAARDEDQTLLAKYLAHQKVVKNQTEQVKVDKGTVGPDQLCCVFDYSTFHDYTKEKVERFQLTVANAILMFGDCRCATWAFSSRANMSPFSLTYWP